MRVEQIESSLAAADLGGMSQPVNRCTGVAEIVPADGEVTEYPVTGMAPVGITTGPDGAIWFCGFGSNEIGRITLDGAVERYPVPTPKSVPYHIVAGPDGALWFTESGNNAIGRITVEGVITQRGSVPGGPDQLVFTPDGSLWVTAYDAGELVRIAKP